jgi:two-component system, cell cycle response regulator
MMPGMESIQVRQKLSESKERPYVYVLLLTGRSQKEDLLAGLGSGADDSLTKPFDAQELRARLHVGPRILGLQDKLIAAANRGVILDTLRRERSRQARDTYGALGGDAMLRETTQPMMASLRPYDTVGRYGGEEFLIVVPSSDAMGALGLSERIRRASAEQAIAAHSVPIAITASFGVAASTEARPLDPQEMLKLADHALYARKSIGETGPSQPRRRI